MEPWKKAVIAAIVIGLLVAAPHTVGAFLSQAFHSLGILVKSFHLH